MRPPSVRTLFSWSVTRTSVRYLQIELSSISDSQHPPRRPYAGPEPYGPSPMPPSTVALSPTATDSRHPCNLPPRPRPAASTAATQVRSRTHHQRVPRKPPASSTLTSSWVMPLASPKAHPRALAVSGEFYSMLSTTCSDPWNPATRQHVKSQRPSRKC